MKRCEGNIKKHGGWDGRLLGRGACRHSLGRGGCRSTPGNACFDPAKRGHRGLSYTPQIQPTEPGMGKEVEPTRERPIVLDDVVRAQIPQVDPVPPVGDPEGRMGDGLGGGVGEVVHVHDGVSELAVGDAFSVAG